MIPKNTLVFETAIDVSILCLITVYHFQLTAPNTQVQKSWWQLSTDIDPLSRSNYQNDQYATKLDRLHLVESIITAKSAHVDPQLEEAPLLLGGASVYISNDSNVSLPPIPFRKFTFIAVFSAFWFVSLTLCALISTVSGCSGAVCGNLCGQKRFPPGFRWTVIGAGREAFLVAVGCIVTLRRVLCKWFLQGWQLRSCGAINLLKSQALIKKSYRQKKSIAKQRRQNGTLGRLK